MDYNPRIQPHRGERKNHPHYLSLRVHRALCWWPSAKSYLKHFNGQFVFLLFAFNAPNLREKWQEKGREKSHKAKQKANIAIEKQHMAKSIEFAVPKLYTLRKHIMHIGANWYINVNHSQLNDSVNLLGQRVPIIIKGMMDNPQAFWGDANYLLVKQGGM
jgi:hypothetical protein